MVYMQMLKLLSWLMYSIGYIVTMVTPTGGGGGSSV